MAGEMPLLLKQQDNF